MTNLFADDFSEGVRGHTLVLIAKVKDDGYAWADEVFVTPHVYRSKD